MSSRRYIICDIEATGLDDDKEIIEIALITYQDDKIIDVYDTLINPLRSVPEFIQGLTAISLRELGEAPKFYDVAEAIRMRLEGSIFVSHNTEFDLGLLIKKFQEMGQELKLKSLCTLKTAQHEIPGLKNYNLDALCSFFHIKIQDRHRALGDARATLELFKELEHLTFRMRPKIMYLPQHERSLKHVPAAAGLLHFIDQEGKTFRFESSFNMQKTARELLQARRENRNLLLLTKEVHAEVTGSALIAEFKKMLFSPYRPQWVIGLEELPSGEKKFKLGRYNKGQGGLWFFRNQIEARKKMHGLNSKLKGDKFAYREGGKSKEEILRANQKAEALSKEARFPSENLLILGEGRTLGERSLVLVRDGHVLGHGYSMAGEEEIYAHPEQFLNTRFERDLGADLAAKKYMRILKNLRQKNEGWRGLSELR